MEPIRGNVDTRLRHGHRGRAGCRGAGRAGLTRLGPDGRDHPDPRPRGDAARARAGRAGRRDAGPAIETAWYADAVRALDDPRDPRGGAGRTQPAGDLEAGCIAPVGALGRVDGGLLTLRGGDGGRRRRPARSGAPALGPAGDPAGDSAPDTGRGSARSGARPPAAGAAIDRDTGTGQWCRRAPVPAARVAGPAAGWRWSTLLGALQARCAEVAVELIAIARPPDTGAVRSAVLAPVARGDFDWVGFTSVNAVDAVVGRAAAPGAAPAVSADTRVAAVGPATAAALRDARACRSTWCRHGPRVGRRAGRGLARRPAAAVRAAAASDIAAPTLPDALTAKGYRVRRGDRLPHRRAPLPADRAAELAGRRFDAVLFTSPSTVQALAGTSRLPPGTVLGAIGEPTRGQRGQPAGLAPVDPPTAPTDGSRAADRRGASSVPPSEK